MILTKKPSVHRSHREFEVYPQTNEKTERNLFCVFQFLYSVCGRQLDSHSIWNEFSIVWLTDSCLQPTDRPIDIFLCYFNCQYCWWYRYCLCLIIVFISYLPCRVCGNIRPSSFSFWIFCFSVNIFPSLLQSNIMWTQIVEYMHTHTL